jgi:hypothetical protein
MIERIGAANLDLQSIEASLRLDKKIVLGDFNRAERLKGHYCDYLDSLNEVVLLCATRDTTLFCWDSASLLHHCHKNSLFSVDFKCKGNELAQDIAPYELELWSSRNRFILRKAKEDIQLTYHFPLFNSHKLTGELQLAPLVYFQNHPEFILNGSESEILKQLVKIPPILVEIKSKQIICFDKYHYQFAYNDDLYFIRVNNANRIN